MSKILIARVLFSVVLIALLAVATVTGNTSVLIADEKGNLHQLDQTNRVWSTWARTAQGRRIKLAEPLALSVLLDGKPVRPDTTDPAGGAASGAAKQGENATGVTKDLSDTLSGRSYQAAGARSAFECPLW